ncbi:hypothetical protein M409DRAFT_28483 [Zasmidium cellare ATCC 36951]|uniref:Methyltransferase domain-containing protein n=1 Tax=Zasmidium cellare ATCC 36951 TaxID=1080233 RepID=A0A6A6C2E2_ZASCE|nr:uncharacterized protein M409DRAFT_28483 [Zasmidium cellare ATCC 36951]KAF2161155.1 hypothetical protein M409DRAFT_28483 [Zasmidium cellare ATCC 36951]
MPDFSQQSYWDTRFAADQTPFDWLLPAQALCTIARDMMDDEAALENAEILHIGCGTSDSSVLRTLVRDPEQVHNVDYSESGVEAGEEREREVLRTEGREVKVKGGEGEGAELLGDGEDEKKHDSASFQEIIKPPPSRTMRWSCMDLLSLQSTLGLLHHQLTPSPTRPKGKLYDLILDKSTSDSISCGQDIPLPLPYSLSINGWTRRLQGSGTSTTGSVHPLHLLAVHLAALTTPRTARWIAISYSEDRFPFLPPFPQSHGAGMLDDGVIKAGFPHPYQLWELERKERVEVGKGEEEETLSERRKRLSMPGYVHRPRVSHWVYVLRRTKAVVID